MKTFSVFSLLFIFFATVGASENLSNKSLKKKIQQSSTPVVEDKISHEEDSKLDPSGDLNLIPQGNKSEKATDGDKNFFLKLKNSFDEVVSVKTSITNTAFETVKEIPKNDKNVVFQLKVGGLFDLEYGHAFLNSIYKDNNLNYANGLGFYPQLRGGANYLSTSQDFNSRAKLDISPEIQFKNFKFGAMFAIPLIKNYDSDPKTASQEYLYIDLDYIKFELGSTFSAAAKMRIDPALSASGTGGVYGDWWRYSGTAIFNTNGLSATDANALNYGYSPVFMIYPTLPNEAGFTSGNVLSSGYTGIGMPVNAMNMQYAYSNQGLPTQGARSNKISFYTKRIFNTQIGFSYSPDTNNTGFMNKVILNTGYLTGGIKNYISLGINYKQQITNAIGLGLSFTYEHGKYYSPTSVYQTSNGTTQVSNLSSSGTLNKTDLNAFAVGGILIYKNLSISYAYNDWLNSLNTYSYLNPYSYNSTYTGSGHSYSHVVGFGANFGNMNFSMQYMYSNYHGNVANIFSIGSDYIIASIRYIRIEPYIEYNFIMLKSASFMLTYTDPTIYQAATKIGSVFITGVRLRF